MIRALLAGRPLWAATMVWKPASPSPGMEVWTSTTFVVGDEDLPRPRCVRSRTASELVPGGGAMVTWRIFSEPALMNAVGRSGASADVTTNSDERDGRRCPLRSSGCAARTVIVGV